MRTFLSAFILACATLIACAASAVADDNGFHEPFQLLDHQRWYLSDGWANGPHQSCEWRADAVAVTGGNLRLTLSDRGGKVRPIGCPEMHTNARLGHGLYEARMRTAAGLGLNTAFFTFVGPSMGVPEDDEIDFEFLGKDPHSVQLNYFTNGQGHHEFMAPLGFDASQRFHDYAIEWTPDKIRWYADGKVIYQTPDGAKIPRNPGYLFLSLWSGSNVEDRWLGPFHYTSPMTADVAWVAYTPDGAPCRFPESLKCKQ
jgi:endo-1,3-1,4-beta-glycanase ExoK